MTEPTPIRKSLSLSQMSEIVTEELPLATEERTPHEVVNVSYVDAGVDVAGYDIELNDGSVFRFNCQKLQAALSERPLDSIDPPTVVDMLSSNPYEPASLPAGTRVHVFRVNATSVTVGTIVEWTASGIVITDGDTERYYPSTAIHSISKAAVQG